MTERHLSTDERAKVLLPLHCDKHLHVGFGPSSEVKCPWCEIERLHKGLKDNCECPDGDCICRFCIIREGEND